MQKLKKYAASKAGRDTLISFGIVIVAFIVMQVLRSLGLVSSLLESLLVPICAYIIMAVSLNLTVGILASCRSATRASCRSAHFPALWRQPA